MLNFLLLLQSDVADLTIGNVPAPTADSLSRLYAPILSFVLVCVLAYFTSRWLSSSKGLRGRSGSLKITDSLSVGYQKSLQLIQAGEKYILVAVTRDRISLISEIPKEDIDKAQILGREGHSGLNTGESEKNVFEKYLRQFISKNKEH